MDFQTQRQEVHSMTHLCPKCGWPYPNHHPSAKHRRAHQRVCGTLEGYKLAVDSSSHSNLHEDDHDREHSDEEHPSPILEGSLDDASSKEIAERPHGSKEEEAFLDAVPHFPEGVPTLQVEERSFTPRETVDVRDGDLLVNPNGIQDRGDCATSEEIGGKNSDSSYTSMQNILEPKNDSQELRDLKIKEPSAGSTEVEESKFAEAPSDFSYQSNVIAAPSSLDIGLESPMDSSAEAGVSSDSGTVQEQLADDFVNEGDIVANEQPGPVSPLLAEDADVIFAAVPSEEFASIEEGRIDALSTVHEPETPYSVSSGNLHAENLKGDENFQMYVVPKDIPVIEHPEALIEGYKNYPLQKINAADNMSLPDTILQKEDSPVSEDSSLSEMKVQKEVSEAPSSDYILREDKSKPDDDLKELKEDVPIIRDVVVCEETVTKDESSGGDACKPEKLEVESINQDLSAVDVPVESSLSLSHEIEAPEILNDIGENNSCESHEKHGTSASEILLQINEVQDNLKKTAAEFAVEPMHLDGVSAQKVANVTKDVECSEERGKLSVIDAKTSPESTTKYQMDQEAVHVQSSDTISPSQSSAAVETSQSPDPSTTTPKILIEDEDVDKFFKTEPLFVAAPECSVDLHSQTDSLEANWGSISVLSNQSDPSITTENELLTPVHEVTPTKAGAEGKGSEKTDVFEAPSFLTLIEPRVGANQTNGALAQHEDEKNEIILNQGASAGKHHSALKNLLVEATQESKLKSSSQKDSFASVQKDETASVTTVGKIMAADDRKSGDLVKEWDSPARYPAGIKREKRKVKGHWIPFMCCSSAN